MSGDQDVYCFMDGTTLRESLRMRDLSLTAANQKILEQQALIVKMCGEGAPESLLMECAKEALTDHVNKEVVKVLEEIKQSSSGRMVKQAYMEDSEVALIDGWNMKQREVAKVVNEMIAERSK